MKITTKTDFIIPFQHIGEEKWDVKTREILANFTDLWENELAEPIEEKTILILENRLNTHLPASLKTFYASFGIPEMEYNVLQDINEIHWLKNTWENAPQYGPDFTDADNQILPYLVTFSYLGGGNIFCFHAQSHEIYLFHHESSPYLLKMFANFDDYLKGCLIFTQAALAENEKQANKIAEELLTDLFSEEVVRTWFY